MPSVSKESTLLTKKHKTTMQATVSKVSKKSICKEKVRKELWRGGVDPCMEALDHLWAKNSS